MKMHSWVIGGLLTILSSNSSFSATTSVFSNKVFEDNIQKQTPNGVTNYTVRYVSSLGTWHEQYKRGFHRHCRWRYTDFTLTRYVYLNVKDKLTIIGTAFWRGKMPSGLPADSTKVPCTDAVKNPIRVNAKRVNTYDNWEHHIVADFNQLKDKIAKTPIETLEAQLNQLGDKPVPFENATAQD